MPHQRNTALAFLVAIALLASVKTAGGSEPALVSSMEMDFSAITAIDGIRVVPAKDMPGKIYTEDHAPSQVLEIIRNGQAPITVGRLMTSCSCLRATMEKKDFGQGERAFIEVRNVKPTQPNGATYLVFVQLHQPYKSTLQHELFVKSTGTSGAPPATVQPQAPAPSVSPQPAKQGAAFKFEGIVPYKAHYSEKTE